MTTTNQTMTPEQMKAEILRLQGEVKAQREANGNLSLKVSEKGAISVYGMGRFPVTLYQEQWTRLIDHSATIKAFIEANKSRLKLKTDAKAAVVNQILAK